MKLDFLTNVEKKVVPQGVEQRLKKMTWGRAMRRTRKRWGTFSRLVGEERCRNEKKNQEHTKLCPRRTLW